MTLEIELGFHWWGKKLSFKLKIWNMHGSPGVSVYYNMLCSPSAMP